MDLHIKDVLKKYITQDRKVGGAYYSQKISTFWNEQLGESIVSRTSSLKFDKGKLMINVTSAPLRHELFNNRKKLKDRINEYLKEDIVHLIELT